MCSSRQIPASDDPLAESESLRDFVEFWQTTPPPEASQSALVRTMEAKFHHPESMDDCNSSSDSRAGCGPSHEARRTTFVDASGFLTFVSRAKKKASERSYVSLLLTSTGCHFRFTLIAFQLRLLYCQYVGIWMILSV